jgi:hypothetical protein
MTRSCAYYFDQPACTIVEVILSLLTLTDLCWDEDALEREIPVATALSAFSRPLSCRPITHLDGGSSSLPSLVECSMQYKYQVSSQCSSNKGWVERNTSYTEYYVPISLSHPGCLLAPIQPVTSAEPYYSESTSISSWYIPLSLGYTYQPRPRGFIHTADSHDRKRFKMLPMNAGRPWGQLTPVQALVGESRVQVVSPTEGSLINLKNKHVILHCPSRITQ